jgi:hypothetical protein
MREKYLQMTTSSVKYGQFISGIPIPGKKKKKECTPI